MRVAVYHTEEHPDRNAMVKVGGRVHETNEAGEIVNDRHGNPKVLSDEPEREVRAADSGHIRPGPTVFAYGQGRILDVPDPRTGEIITRQEIAEALLERARKDFPPPHYEVRLEKLVDRVSDQPKLHPETGEPQVDPETGEPIMDVEGEWVPLDDETESSADGQVVEHELLAAQDTSSDAEV